MFGNRQPEDPMGQQPPDEPKLVPQRTFRVTWSKPLIEGHGPNRLLERLVVCRQIVQSGDLLLFSDVVKEDGNLAAYLVWAVPVKSVVEYEELLSAGMTVATDSKLVTH